MSQGNIRRALSTHGRRRTKAREQVAEETAAIAALVHTAVDAGLTKREIAERAQISRPALDAMLKGDG